MRYILISVILLFISCASDDSSPTANSPNDDNSNDQNEIPTDQIAPVITIIGESEVIVLQFTGFEDPGATATDNIDGDITESIVTESNVNLSAPGTYTIIYSVSDSAGNMSSANRAVIVKRDENYTYVPDDAFEQKLIYFGVDNILNDYVLTSNLSGIKKFSMSEAGVSDLTGIEDFTSLESLWLYGNSIDSLNFSNNEYLKSLTVWQNEGLTYLDISQNEALEKLVLTPALLSNLDLSNNQNLVELSFSGLSIEQLDLSNNLGLVKLAFSNSNIVQLDLSNNTQLQEIIISEAPLTSVNLTGLQDLVEIDIRNTELNNIALPVDASNLVYIELLNNKLTSIDLSEVNSNSLFHLLLQNNLLSSLDISGVPRANYFSCYNNQLVSLNLANGNNGQIYEMKAAGNLLDCIQIDPGFTPPSSWDKDSSTIYSENCD